MPSHYGHDNLSESELIDRATQAERESIKKALDEQNKVNNERYKKVTNPQPTGDQLKPGETIDTGELDEYGKPVYESKKEALHWTGWPLHLLGKVGEGFDWIDKQAGIGEFNVYNARRKILDPLSEQHFILGLLGEIFLPDSIDIVTAGFSYIPNRFRKLGKVGARIWAKAGSNAISGTKRAQIVADWNDNLKILDRVARIEGKSLEEVLMETGQVSYLSKQLDAIEDSSEWTRRGNSDALFEKLFPTESPSGIAWTQDINTTKAGGGRNKYIGETTADDIPRPVKVSTTGRNFAQVDEAASYDLMKMLRESDLKNPMLGEPGTGARLAQAGDAQARKIQGLPRVVYSRRNPKTGKLNRWVYENKGRLDKEGNLIFDPYNYEGKLINEQIARARKKDAYPIEQEFIEIFGEVLGKKQFKLNVEELKKFNASLYNMNQQLKGTGKTLQKDHIAPIAKGGLEIWNNLMPLLDKYNLAKGAKLLPDEVYKALGTSANRVEAIERSFSELWGPRLTDEQKVSMVLKKLGILDADLSFYSELRKKAPKPEF